MHTPYKRPGRGGFKFVGCPIFGRQGRAQKHTPHKRPEGADSCLLDAPFSSVRVGRKSIRPTKRPDRGGFMFVGCPIFGRQGRGVLNTPPESGMMGPGRLPLGVCRCNRVRTFVPLAGTLGRAYAFAPLPIRTKNRNSEKMWVQKMILSF